VRPKPRLIANATDRYRLQLPSDRPTNETMTGRGAGMAEQDGGGTLLMSYAELGRRLGMSPDGARSRARRAGWPVIKGNNGRCRVRVHAAEIADQPQAGTDRHPEQNADVTALLTELRRSHADQIADLTARLDRAEQAGQDWRATSERDRALAELLRDQLALEQRRAGDLAAELREARRPWLVRVLAAIRR
jgi:hypothetical protein